VKKIIFSLKLGIIGQDDSGKNIFLNFLEKESIPKNILNNNINDRNFLQYTIVHELVPIKIKIYQADDLDFLLKDYKQIRNLDILMLALNLYHLNSKNDYRSSDLERFIKKYSFKGISCLVGFDTEGILKGNLSKDFRISRYNLIQKVKELDLMYCFEIKNDKNDLIELYQILLNDYIFKLHLTNPDLLEKAKKYGDQLKRLKVNY
jgi:hypothetical protein